MIDYIYIDRLLHIALHKEMAVNNNQPELPELSDLTLLDFILQKKPEFKQEENNVNIVVDELSSNMNLLLAREEYSSIPKEIKNALAVYYSIFHHRAPSYMFVIDVYYFVHSYAYQFIHFQSLVNSDIFINFKANFDNIALLLPD
jgi:hypothetical protein